MDQLGVENMRGSRFIVNYGRRSRFRQLPLRALLASLTIAILLFTQGYLYYRKNAARLELLYLQWRASHFDAPIDVIAYQLDEPFYYDGKRLSKERPDCLKLLALPGYIFDSKTLIRPYGFDVWYKVGNWDLYMHDWQRRVGGKAEHDIQPLNMLFFHDRSSASGHNIVCVTRILATADKRLDEDHWTTTLNIIGYALKPATLQADEQLLPFKSLLLKFIKPVHLLIWFGQIDRADDTAFYIPYTVDGLSYKISGRLNADCSVSLLDTRQMIAPKSP